MSINKKITELPQGNANKDSLFISSDLSESLKSNQSKKLFSTNTIESRFFHIRKVFETEDLSFEQVNSGSDPTVSIQQDTEGTDIYTWSTTQANNSVSFKVVEDFQIPVTPIEGVIHLFFHGGIEMEPSGGTNEIDIISALQKDIGDGTGFQDIVSTDAFYYFNPSTGSSIAASSFGFHVGFDPDNPIFEIEDTLRILMTIRTFRIRSDLTDPLITQGNISMELALETLSMEFIQENGVIP